MRMIAAHPARTRAVFVEVILKSTGFDVAVIAAVGHCSHSTLLERMEKLHREGAEELYA